MAPSSLPDGVGILNSPGFSAIQAAGIIIFSGAGIIGMQAFIRLVVRGSYQAYQYLIAPHPGAVIGRPSTIFPVLLKHNLVFNKLVFFLTKSWKSQAEQEEATCEDTINHEE